MFNLEKEFIFEKGNGMLDKGVLGRLHVEVTREHNAHQLRSARNEQRVIDFKANRPSRAEIKAMKNSIVDKK